VDIRSLRSSPLGQTIVIEKYTVAMESSTAHASSNDGVGFFKPIQVGARRTYCSRCCLDDFSVKSLGVPKVDDFCRLVRSFSLFLFD
jgi:hypothetical protein